MNNDGHCIVCQMKADLFCGKCHVVRYCSRDHQKIHWKSHKQACFPCRTEKNEELGRYLTAARYIKAGETILIDSPLVIGPKQVTAPLCLGCFRPVKGEFSCSSCGWPMCSPKCSSETIHNAECQLSRVRSSGIYNGETLDSLDELSSKISIKTFDQVNPMYECITPLKCLWLRDSNPENWELFSTMESHNEQRKSTVNYQMNQSNVVDFIRGFLRLKDIFSDKEIHTVCGILEVNGFEIPGPDLVGLFPFACLLEHSCISNTIKTFDPQLRLVVKAAVDIPKGNHITTSYTDPLWGERSRKLQLSTSKYFTCQCSRCLDPTDRGTHLSSIRCKECPNGIMPPPRDQQSSWECNSCKNVIDSKSIEEMLQLYGEKMIKLRGNVNASEKFLKETQKILCEDHHYRMEVKLALTQLYGKQGPNQIEDLSAEELERKTDLCRKVLKLADIFAPGLSRLRAILLRELQLSLQESYKRMHNKIRKKKGGQLLQECETCLTEAVSIFQIETHLQEDIQTSMEAEDDLIKLRKFIQKERR